MTTETNTTTPATPSGTPLMFQAKRATLAHALSTVGVGLVRRPVLPMVDAVAPGVPAEGTARRPPVAIS